MTTLTTLLIGISLIAAWVQFSRLTVRVERLERRLDALSRPVEFRPGEPR